jgi:hypothetical protein
MSKTIFFCAAAIATTIFLAACGGTSGGTPHTATQEYDPNSGSWRQPSKIITAPPSQGGAVIVERKKPGMLKKVGDTLKAPLKWVGLGKDEAPASAQPQAGTAPAKPAQQ